jgi:hypothetical protein
MSCLKRFFLKLFSWLLPDSVCLWLLHRHKESLRAALEDALVETLLEVLLEGMSLAFLLLRGFRRNLSGFSGKYLFRTANGGVALRALFASRHLSVLRGESADYDVAVTFTDSAAFCRFLFSSDQDILASLLANDVTVDGNLNYVYKFGFMARDLIRRLSLAELVDRMLARLRTA